MPQYNYRCPNGHTYEEVRSILEDQKTKDCPECGASLKQSYSPPGIQFRGHGFYRNTQNNSKK
jgi:putative FmdB family regulatory protein